MRNAPRNGGEHEEPPRYAVIVSDLADAEAREAHQWLQENYSQDYADRWLEGLTRATVRIGRDAAPPCRRS